MLIKEKVLEAIQSLPAQFSIDDLVERLIVLHKIEAGLQQVAQGKTLNTQEAKEKLKKWLK
jgi:predicted transcriptional regulator